MRMHIPVAVRRDLYLAAVIMAVMIAVPMAVTALWGPEPEEARAAAQIGIIEQLAAVQATGEAEDPQEDAKITEALMEQGYYRDDIPLSNELQDYLHTAAEQAGIPYELALAVIKKETNFQNVVGDDGCSVGYMQIQEKWHKERMERLGVSDLNEPYGNFQVGCDFLSELLWRYGEPEDALTAYNSGHPGKSQYARDVIAYWNDYTKG